MKNDKNSFRICPHCAEERYKKTQESLDSVMPSAIKSNNFKDIYFKVELVDGKDKEFVWIFVDKIDSENRTFTGIIANEISMTSYRLGQSVSFSFNDIHQIEL